MFRSRAGMTLIELVVALAVTGLALAAGVAAFGSVVDHRERAAQATDEIARAAALRQTLESWLGGAQLGAYQGAASFQGLDAVHEGTPDDQILFQTTAPASPEARSTRVHLYVDRDPLTPERGLVAELQARREGEPERIELEPRVVGLDLRYLSDLSGERRWLPSWISSSSLPLGVEMRLLSAAPDTLPALLRLPIVVPFGGGR